MLQLKSLLFLKLEHNSPHHDVPVVNSEEDNEWHGFRLTGDNIDTERHADQQPDEISALFSCF